VTVHGRTDVLYCLSTSFNCTYLQEINGKKLTKNINQHNVLTSVNILSLSLAPPTSHVTTSLEPLELFDLIVTDNLRTDSLGLVKFCVNMYIDIL